MYIIEAMLYHICLVMKTETFPDVSPRAATC